jgi:gluconolactonase
MAEMRQVTDGLSFPEGPVALPDGDVLVVEVGGGRLTRVSPDGSKRTVADLGGGPNGAALGPDGEVYVVNNGGFAWSDIHGHRLPIGPDGGNEPEGFTGGWVERVDLATGAVQRLYDDYEGLRFLGPNDIVRDATGGLWFTDFGKLRPRTVDRGAVYYAAPDGSSLRLVADHLIGPNGIGLSPDGTRLFVAETYTGRLLAWDIVGPGEVAGRPTVMVATAEHFDSLAVEADGTVVVAAMRGLCVVRPDSSWELLPLPDMMTTNICFGGDDLRTAFVTLSGAGVLVQLDWPRPGLRLN